MPSRSRGELTSKRLRVRFLETVGNIRAVSRLA